MGRQKGHHLNVIAKKLLEKRPDLFSTDFKTNKEQIVKLGILKETHQERNKLAGEITNLVKQMRAEEEDRGTRAPTYSTRAPAAAAAA